MTAPPGTDEPLVWYEGTGTGDRRWLHADAQGSVVAVTNSLGTVTATNTYDEYGIPGASNAGRFQYTGQTWVPELGMYYYKARMYSPTLGRFMQTDPVGYEDGLNWYSYVGNDPRNGTDPSGSFGMFGGCPAGSRCTSTAPAASNAAIPTTSGERAAVKLGTEAGVNKYWASRCQRGDPAGCLAREYISTNTANGVAAISRAWLEDAIKSNIAYVGVDTNGRYQYFYDQDKFSEIYVSIRWDLAWSHMTFVDRDRRGVPGLLSEFQVARYHHDVFTKYGISTRVFGGSPITGSVAEAWVWQSFWCGKGSRGCDDQ